MAKKKKLKISKDKLKIGSIIYLILSFVIYFRLFFIGAIISDFINLTISNVFFLLLLTSSYAILILLNYQNLVKKYELIGILILYISINLISNQSLLAKSITQILSVIITENLTKLIYFICLILGTILIIFRFKNVIFKELNLKVKETNSTILNYKNKIETKKIQKFEKLSKNNIEVENYITNFFDKSPEIKNKLIETISKNYTNEYANSIYEYIDNVKSAIIKIYGLNDQEVIFTQEQIKIEKICIKYVTKEITNKKQIINKISKMIPNSKISNDFNTWTLTLSYKSNILLSIKDMINYYDNYQNLCIGISSNGNYIKTKEKNLFINYENIHTLNSFLETIFFQKSILGEKYIIIDFSNKILKNISNKENVIYDVITNKKTLLSLLKLIDYDICSKSEYANDLGYKTYQNYVKTKKIKYDKITIVFHEISYISLNSNNYAYILLNKIVKQAKDYGYEFIFTNSKESKQILQSEIYLNTPNKLYFETYTNSFSKLLVKSKILKMIENKYIFYYLINKKLIKIYFPGKDLQKDNISNLIHESLNKNSLKQEELQNMWILDELIIKRNNNEVITATYIVTKYKISTKQAQNLITKINKMR